MKRWHEDYYKFTFREWKEHRHWHVESNKDDSKNRIGLDPYDVGCACDEQKGRFRKKDAWDCGKTQCRICHFDKYFGKNNGVKKLRADLNFREQLRELRLP